MMQKLGAEFIGTFVLVFVGCGAAVIGGAGLLGTALAFGLAAAAMIYAVGGKSGGHFNPAVSIAMAINGRFCWKCVLPYIIAQVLGAMGAAGMLHIIGGGASEAITNLGANGFGTNSIGGYGQNTALLAEVIVTALFVMMVLGISKGKNMVGPLATGLGLAALIMVAYNITGGSLNPARSMGPAVVMGGDAFDQLWVFWVGPLLGAVVGAYLYKWAICCGTCTEGGSCSTKEGSSCSIKK